MPRTTWSIQRIYALKSSIYGDADMMFLQRYERFLFLSASCADLARCCRKQQAHLYPIALAQTFSWLLCVVDGFLRDSGGTFLATAMGEKYPMDKCGYCGELPCRCKEEARTAHVPAVCSPAQRAWSMKAWEMHLDHAYGTINRTGGIARALNRLFEEVVEVELVLQHVDGFNEPACEVANKISRELSDVLAWIFAVAIVLEVDLQQAVLDLYEKGCPVCRKPKCACRNFEIRPSTGSLTHRFVTAEDIYLRLNK